MKVLSVAWNHAFSLSSFYPRYCPACGVVFDSEPLKPDTVSVYAHAATHPGHCLEVRGSTLSVKCICCTKETALHAAEALIEAEQADAYSKELKKKEYPRMRTSGSNGLGYVESEASRSAAEEDASSTAAVTLLNLLSKGGKPQPHSEVPNLVSWTKEETFGTPLEPVSARL